MAVSDTLNQLGVAVSSIEGSSTRDVYLELRGFAAANGSVLPSH
ncbi:MAG: hypothetical protein ACFCBW_11435 [Candidatus Competibacterales bacterium]